MDIATLSGHINMLVSEFLEAGGDPAHCGDLLREIADDVFEEPEEGPDQLSLWYDTSAELR